MSKTHTGVVGTCARGAEHSSGLRSETIHSKNFIQLPECRQPQSKLNTKATYYEMCSVSWCVKFRCKEMIWHYLGTLGNILPLLSGEMGSSVSALSLTGVNDARTICGAKSYVMFNSKT